jgi:3-deoxy-D-manno-octulosonate 8-phosphate phosphatase (KDO 8-P phosphatase)
MFQNLKANSIRAVIFDFDGVFTDNSVYVGECGKEMVRCSRSDGIGLQFLIDLGLPLIVISSEVNPVVSIRCAKLGIPCEFGVSDKIAVATKWLKSQHVKKENTLFVCNDINDIPLMKVVGHSWCVQDAWPEVKRYADFELTLCGGYGAVREVCEIIRHSKHKEKE